MMPQGRPRGDAAGRSCRRPWCSPPPTAPTGRAPHGSWLDTDVTYAHYPFPLYPYGGPGSGSIEGTPHSYPGYQSPFAGGLPGFSYGDVGIVVLDEPAPNTAFAKLPSAGLVDTLRNKTSLDYVGYGVQIQVKEPGVKPFDRWAGPRIRNYAPGQLHRPPTSRAATTSSRSR